jgi:mycobactin salicyl-AMP ligase
MTVIDLGELASPQPDVMLPPWVHLTIDGLSRLSARARANDFALTEAPDTGVWYHRSAQSLTQAELQARARRFGQQMEALGLARGDRVILHLPNVVDLTVAMLGLQAAGFVPCPVPIGWDLAEMRNACDSVTAKAIITTARYGQVRPAELARQVAAAVFSIRFVCAFGSGLPDGVVALDAWDDVEFSKDEARTQSLAGDVALVTFDRRDTGLMPLARTHNQLISDALAISTAARIVRASHLVTTIAAATAMGVVAGMVVPVLSGAHVHLHGPFDSRVLAVQLAALEGAHLLIPGALEPVLGELNEHLAGKIATPMLLHRWPPPSSSALVSAQPAPMRLVDLHALGETAVISAVRHSGVVRKTVPVRVAHPAGHVLRAGIPQFECTLDEAGQLLVRGFSVPAVFGRSREDEPEWQATGLRAAATNTDDFDLEPAQDLVRASAA